MTSLKVLVQNSQTFVANPKICLFSCFANTYVPPEPPKRGIIFFWSPGTISINVFAVSVSP